MILIDKKKYYNKFLFHKEINFKKQFIYGYIKKMAQKYMIGLLMNFIYGICIVIWYNNIT